MYVSKGTYKTLRVRDYVSKTRHAIRMFIMHIFNVFIGYWREDLENNMRTRTELYRYQTNRKIPVNYLSLLTIWLKICDN